LVGWNRAQNTGNASVVGCVALNTSISSTTARKGRVTGLDSGSLGNNYGRVDMQPTPNAWPNNNDGASDGDDVSDAAAKTITWWTTPANWGNYATWATSSVWTLSNGSYPKLKGVGGQ